MFDQELIAQVVAAGMAARIGEIAVPTRYFEEASSVGFRRSVVYGLSTLRVVARYVLHRLRVRRSPKLRRPPSGLTGDADQPERAPARDARDRGQRLRDLDPHPFGRPRRRVRGPADGVAGLDRRDAGGGNHRHRRTRGARWRTLLAPIAPLPYRRVLGYTYIGYLANNVLPARLGELYRSHALGEGEGVSRTTVLGTVVVERVVDTVMVVAIASVAVLVLSVRGAMSSAVLLGLAFVSLLVIVLGLGIAAHRLPGAGRVTEIIARRPRLLELARRLREGLAVAGRPRVMVVALAFSALAWAASICDLPGRRPGGRRRS